jgi:hypothetical protein
VRAGFTLTVFFDLTGSFVVLSERLRIRFVRLPIVARWGLHSVSLGVCYVMALLLTQTAMTIS